MSRHTCTNPSAALFAILALAFSVQAAQAKTPDSHNSHTGSESHKSGNKAPTHTAPYSHTSHNSHDSSSHKHDFDKKSLNHDFPGHLCNSEHGHTDHCKDHYCKDHCKDFCKDHDHCKDYCCKDHCKHGCWDHCCHDCCPCWWNRPCFRTGLLRGRLLRPLRLRERLRLRESLPLLRFGAVRAGAGGCDRAADAGHAEL